MAATRFYLPNGGTVPNISPAYVPSDATESPPASRSVMATTKQNTPLATLVSTWPTGQGYGSALYNQRTVRQFVGPPMTAQTISGTFSIVLKTAATEDSTDHPADVPKQDRLNISIFVYGSNNVQRGTLRYVFTDFSTVVGNAGQGAAATLETRIFPSTALDSLAVLDGDRLVVNIGWRGDIANGHTRSYVFGDPSAGVDHTLVAGQTMVGVPWIEFSQDIFNPPTGTPVSTTRSITANLNGRISATRTITANIGQILTSISASRIITANLKALVSAPRSISADLKNALSNSRIISADLKQQLSSSRIISASINASFAAVREISADIRKQVSTSREITANLFEKISTISREITADIRKQVSLSREITANLFGQITSVSREISANISQIVSTSRTVSSNIFEKIATISREISSSISQTVSVSRIIESSLLKQITSVSRNITANIQARVEASRTASADIKELISTERSVSAKVKFFVSTFRIVKATIESFLVPPHDSYSPKLIMHVPDTQTGFIVPDPRLELL